MNLKLKDTIALILDNRGKNPPYYSSSGIAVIDNALIQESRYPNLNSNIRFIDYELASAFLRDTVLENDVLITLVGNGYGNCCLCPKNSAIIQNKIGLRFNNLLLQMYGYYLLLSKKQQIRLLNRGASQPSIKISDLLHLEIDIPSISLQNHIVNTISILPLISF